MTASSAERAVLDFVEELSGIRLTPEEHFEETRALDSLGWIVFVAFIERKFGIQISEDDLDRGVLRSAAATIAYLRRVGALAE